MDLRDNLIIIDNKNQTNNVVDIVENNSNFYNILFSNNYTTNRYYSYRRDRVLWIKKAKYLNVNEHTVIGKYNNKLNNLKHISLFMINNRVVKIYVEFLNGEYKYYDNNEVKFSKNDINNVSVTQTINYLKDICKSNKLVVKNIDNTYEEEKTLGDILFKYFEQLTYIEENTPVDCFLKRKKLELNNTDYDKDELLIYPFGCNNSQMKAVKNALNNRLSIIEGPPGTGKTQTILNILANIVIRQKTVLVASNNNSAIENIVDKMKSYGYDFIIAKLGSRENKNKFINNQSDKYENLKKWEHLELEKIDYKQKLLELQTELVKYYNTKEIISREEKELEILQIQNKYLELYLNNHFSYLNSFRISKDIKSSLLKQIWTSLNTKSIKGKTKVSFLEKIKYCLIYRVGNLNLYKLSLNEILLVIQKYYYGKYILELEQSLMTHKTYTSNTNSVKTKKDFEDLSKHCFEHLLFEKYKKINKTTFKLEDLNRNWVKFINEYPIILSTTYSAKKSLSSECLYDYLIIDEASQVDIATGTIAMTCARNVVVVGDLKQLPNVVSENDLIEFDKLLNKYNLSDEYSFKNSFMKSVEDVLCPPKTLLKEHYRCHPKIIEFCNEKFYNNELLIMTENNGEKDVVELYKTNIGNHQRNNYSERQIDIIFKEIIPNLHIDDYSQIGIIAPYREQVEKIKQYCQNTDIEVDTVHKFQGREKDVIILSTVSDCINDFVDNPNLLNVAISRAKNKFVLVMSGNPQNENSNIMDLVKYIEYNNFVINKSKINSIFDLLYKQYTNERLAYITEHKKVSEYDSENVMYGLICDIFKENNINNLDVVLHYPLRYLCSDLEDLANDEKDYINNSGTHLDFLIYNKFDNKPCLAIEVDGYKYHKVGTRQYDNDIIKDRILDKIGLRHLRFKTNGSCEKEKILEYLK